MSAITPVRVTREDVGEIELTIVVHGTSDATATILFHATGEERAQFVDYPFAMGWRATAERRLREFPRWRLTPLYVIRKPRAR